MTTRELVYAPPRLRAPIPAGALGICPGCGHFLVSSLIAQVVEEMGIGNKTIHVNGMGCHAIAGSVILADWAGCSHGTAPAVATGIKRVYPESVVYTIQGDGDAIAIGAGALLNAAIRGEKITVVELNNTNYGTTGGQQAPTTLVGQVTTTTPSGRDAEVEGYPANVPEMLTSLKSVAYSARGAVNNPKNYQQTKKFLKTAFQKQMDNEGFTFLEILSTCPTNWHMTPTQAAKWVQDVAINEYPLGEFKNA